MSQILIKDVKVGKRFRHEMGDIKTLIESIQEVDLLHPIVVDENNNLIAGRRRLQACKQIGWKTIPCTVISIDDEVIGEFHENAVRKNFTATEIAEITEYIESTRRDHRPKKGEESPPLPGKTRDVVARLTGKSTNTIDKIKQIKEAAKKNPRKFASVLERVDAEKMSVNTAHKMVTQRQRSLPKADLPKGKVNGLLVDFPTGFNRGKTAHGSADNHYPTMTPEQILKWIDDQDASTKVANNTVGFFWFSTSIQYSLVAAEKSVAFDMENGVQFKKYTVPTPVYKALLDKLGFDQVLGEFVWKKDKIGLGSIVRNQHEKCLIAFKGKVQMPAKNFSSIIEAERGEHSRKPEIYDILEEMYPGRHWAEWFSRFQGKRKRWVFHGNQIGGGGSKK